MQLMRQLTTPSPNAQDHSAVVIDLDGEPTPKPTPSASKTLPQTERNLGAELQAVGQPEGTKPGKS